MLRIMLTIAVTWVTWIIQKCIPNKGIDKQ